MKKVLLILRFLLGALLFTLGAFFSIQNLEIPAFLTVFVLGVLECGLLLFEGEHLLSLRMLFSASWLFGIALCNLKLSALQSVFPVKTFVVLGLFYFMFMGAYEFTKFLVNKRKNRNSEEVSSTENEAEDGPQKALLSAQHYYTESYGKRVIAAIYTVLALALLGVLLEAIKFDFVFPLFAKGKPHAYTEFHISGIHYFVVSVVLVPALSVSYFLHTPFRKKRLIELLIVNLVAVSVPILLLSKFQLFLFFAFPIILLGRKTKRLTNGKLALILLGAAVIIGGLFGILIGKRGYADGYLEGIFQFKNPSTPMWIQYPYIYIVNNFENLNLLIVNVKTFSFGIREAFPFFALTGLKFLPGVENFLQWENVPSTIEELTTVTVLYDAYGDFGTVGAALFGGILGAVSALVGDLLARKNKIFTELLYAQISVYLGLSFFSVWFSLPATWFYFIASLAIGIFADFPLKGRKKHGT